MTGPRASNDPAAQHSGRRFVLCLLLTLLPVLTLWAPKAIDDSGAAGGCRVPLLLAHGASMTSNCDTRTMTTVAAVPHLFFESQWISRPAYVFAGRTLAPLAAVVATPAWVFFLGEGASAPFDVDWFAKTFPTHVALMALHGLALAGAIFLVANMVGPARAHAWVPIGLILLNTELVRAFYLSPHPSILNVPLVVLLVWLLAQGGPLLLRRRWLMGGLFGLAFLAYGGVMLVLPAGILAIARTVRQGEGAASVGATARRVLPFALRFAAGFCALPLAWSLYVSWAVGANVSTEISDHRQFVWVFDAIGDGTLWSEFVRRGTLHLANTITAAREAVPAALALAAVAALCVRYGREAAHRGSWPGSPAIAAAALAPVFSLYYFFVGWYDERLASVAVVAVVLAATLAAAAARAVAASAGLWLAALASLGWTATTAPTF